MHTLIQRKTTNRDRDRDRYRGGHRDKDRDIYRVRDRDRGGEKERERDYDRLSMRSHQFAQIWYNDVRISGVHNKQGVNERPPER